MSKISTNQEELTTSALSDVVKQNIKALLKEKKISQQRLAETTGFAPATISNYVNGSKFPTIDFLWALKQKYGISIDDFITEEINLLEIATPSVYSQIEEQELNDYNNFCGTYFVYYLDTSKYKGRDYNSSESSLMFGILKIYKNNSVSKLDYNCFAILGLKDKANCLSIKNQLDSFENISDSLKYVHENYEGYTYFGDFELTQRHAFLSLSHKSKDKALAIFHRAPNSRQKYAGGIGTINSVSRGREPMPVVQFLGISRSELTFSNEEIHHNLLLNYPNFKVVDEANELITLFKNLYLLPGEYKDSLTELQKSITIKSNLERHIKKSLEKNMFRYGKISNRDDDEWYHTLKDIAKLDDEGYNYF